MLDALSWDPSALTRTLRSQTNKQTKHNRVAGIIYMKLVDKFTLLIFLLDERIKNISLVRSFISVFVFLFDSLLIYLKEPKELQT